MPRPRRDRARVTLVDVARHAGVSSGTVSNVINHPDRVTESTRMRVERSIAELGFSADGNASALARGRSRTLGLVMIDLSNSLFADLAHGAQAEARRSGLRLHLATADDSPELLAEHVRDLIGARVAGMLVAPLSDVPEVVDHCRRHGCPVVLLNHDGSADEACRVVIDNERAGYLAARHLIETGRRRIVFVAGRSDLEPVELRLRGARRAVDELGAGTAFEVRTASGLDVEAGRAVGAELATPGVRPDAVLAVTDVLGMAIVGELRAAGVRVPDDIAVMGCDHNSAAWGGAIPLTSVTMEGEEMGRAGVELLRDELEDDPATHVHRRIVLEPTLVPRESTVGRQPATADEGVSPPR